MPSVIGRYICRYLCANFVPRVLKVFPVCDNSQTFLGSHTATYLLTCLMLYCRVEAVVMYWLSSWLAKPEVRGSIPDIVMS